MAYNDTDKLIKVGNYVIPHRFIAAETYRGLYSTADLDSYRDANGVLHRNPLAHKSGKVEFNTPRLLTNADVKELMSNIQSQYTDALAKTATVKFYVPEYDEYVTQSMYIPDITFEIYGIFNGIIKYNAIRIVLIGY